LLQFYIKSYFEKKLIFIILFASVTSFFLN